jgi:hypothetical protein
LVTTYHIGTTATITPNLVTVHRVPMMSGIVLRSVHPVCKQGDNKAGSVPCEQTYLV